MMRVLYRRGDGTIETSLAAGDIPGALADPRGLLWVDICGESHADCRRLFHDVFGFHPLAVDDALEQSHGPKIDDWDTYAYVVLHAVSYLPAGADPLAARELDIFLGRGYVVTHREDPIEPVDAVWKNCLVDERLTGRGAARLLYHIVDEVVAGHMPALDALDADAERIEARVISAPGRASLHEVLRLKRALMHLRRIVAPQRETLSRLARDEIAVVPAEARIYFRDVYDHLVRLHDVTEGLRDLASGTLETYLSVVNNRMNEVMKVFTLITTLFMPLTFITGFFGMNFFSPESPPAGWTGRIAFAAVCAATVIVPLVMFAWLRRRKWV
jgi:magnesium transporter